MTRIIKMQATTSNTSRTLLTAILILVIGGLVYILVTHDANKSQDLNVGIDSPTPTDKTAPAPRGEWDDDFDNFNDGLTRPSAETKNAPDEFGVGITSVRVYNRDLNNDGRDDRIIRTHIENGTSHFTNEYKIQLATDNGWTDITPTDFHTLEGAECALQKLRFYFNPTFTVEIIGRSMGENYITPTMAYRTIYKMNNNQLIKVSHTPLTEVCDVSSLFDQ